MADPDELEQRGIGLPPASQSRPLRREEDLILDENPEVLFEDEYLLVVAKGAPLPAHPVSRFQTRNLLSILERRYGQKLFLANRLDSETSGLILAARDEGMAGELGKIFQSKRIHKEYIAVVRGAPPDRKGWIRAPIKGRRDHLCHIYEPHPDGKPAETEYEVLETFVGYSLLRLVAHTGRTHQLRVHLKSIGCPIAGDKIYIDLKVYDEYVHLGWQPWMADIVGPARLALHASKLAFEHPVTHQKLLMESPFPTSLLRFFKPAN